MAFLVEKLEEIAFAQRLEGLGQEGEMGKEEGEELGDMGETWI